MAGQTARILQHTYYSEQSHRVYLQISNLFCFFNSEDHRLAPLDTSPFIATSQVSLTGFPVASFKLQMQ